MNSLGEYRLIQYTGSQLEAIQHFSFSQIPHEIIDPLTPRLQILEHPYLSSDCKILSINDIIYRMVPAPFTKMMNVNFTTKPTASLTTLPRSLPIMDARPMPRERIRRSPADNSSNCTAACASASAPPFACRSRCYPSVLSSSVASSSSASSPSIPFSSGRRTKASLPTSNPIPRGEDSGW